jgi:hypothetical protein
MITLDKQPNGDLKIILNDKEELEDVRARPYTDERDALFDMMERSGYIGNGFDCVWNAGLTEAPVIGEDVSFDEGGDIVNVSELWYYKQYMILDFLKELEEHGEVIFTKHI